MGNHRASQHRLAVPPTPAFARTTIVEATRADWTRAVDLYTAREDKDWSLVDCSSIQICKEHGITRVITADRHFARAGLECCCEERAALRRGRPAPPSPPAHSPGRLAIDEAVSAIPP